MNRFKKWKILAALFLCICIGNAQPFQDFSIPVERDGVMLQNAWSGGLDLPQFSGVDIDGDGDEDLVIFDRQGHKWLVYVNDGNYNYGYTFSLDEYFPTVINMGVLRDYNCDGKPDIFAHANGGIQVFQNTSSNGELEFTLVEELLEYYTGFGYVNMYKYNYDIPAIEDFDGDGDIDILSFGTLGTTVPYYINQSVENGYGCDSLIFDLATNCWGNFKESNSDNSVQLDYACKGAGATNGQGGGQHVGSSLCAFDPDKDGDMDLLLGDVSYNNLVYLDNGGTNTTSNIVAFDTLFPSYDVPVDVPIFPAAYYIDVTGDSEKDLIVVPNSPDSYINQESIYVYENNGTTNTPLELSQTNFLMESMLDFGSHCYPLFFDHNGDGLQDLIVANGYIFNGAGNNQGSLFYFENTGTETEPAFTFVTDDYAGLSAYNLEFIRPSLGDLDEDGDLDMIIGASDGKIHYFMNNGIFGGAADFVLSQLDYFSIDIGSYAHPFLYDMNQDGLLDMVVGGGLIYGEISYYENFGISGVPAFHVDSVNLSLGNVRVAEPGFLQGYSAPYILETDTGTIMYVGSDRGYIHRYFVDTDSLDSGSFEQIDSIFLKNDIGRRSTIAITDINDDNITDYFVGNARGGLTYYSDTAVHNDTAIIVNPPPPPNSIDDLNNMPFEMYPNPTENFVKITFEEENNYQLAVYDLLGAEILFVAFEEDTYNLDVRDLASGVYHISIENKEGKRASQKLIVH